MKKREFLALAFVALVLPWTLLAEEVLSFPVKDGAFYHVKVKTQGTGATLRLAFRDSDGQDLEPTERTLGYPISTRTAKIVKDGETVLEARAGGRTGTIAAQGYVTLSDNSSVHVISAIWGAGELVQKSRGRGTPQNVSTNLVETAFSNTVSYAHNLLENPSFEDCLDGKPAHWRFVGEGEARLIEDAYAGNCAVELTEAEKGGRWISDSFDIKPSGRLEMLFAIRFSQHANPGEHVCPVQIEFLDEKNRVVPHAKRSAFAFNYYRPHHMADWGVMSVSPHIVPEKAVKARVVLRFRDREGKRFIGWGNISIDNIAVWQTEEEVSVPFALNGLFGASQLLAKTKPPKLPVGDCRNSSVWAIQPVTDTFNMFFARESKPSVELALANFLSCPRTITLRGTLIDPDGNEQHPIETSIELAPYELKRHILPVEAPQKYGVYSINYELFDGEVQAGGGTATFAWLDHRPNISKEERWNINYPFDMHPSGGLNFSSYAHYSDEVREADVKLAALLGVGGMRLQMRQPKMSSDPEENAALARKDVADWRERVLPHFKRYGLRCWPTFMEQGARTYFPQDEEDAAAWKAYWRAFGAAVSNDVEFLLFGNEGIGGYVRGFGLDEDLSKRSDFRGTIRQWVNAYQALHTAVHETNPSLNVGFSMAGDVNGEFTKFFYEQFPTIQREVWAINGYIRPWEMVANCAKAMGQEQAKAFGVLPELGSDSGNPDWDARCREAAEAMAMTYMDVKAANPRMRRLAWFIQRTGDQQRFGVYSYTYQPRPAAAAYAVMTDTLGAGRVIRTVKLPDGGRFHVWERINGDRIGIGVSPKEMSVVASVSGNLTKMDIYGNREVIAGKKGWRVIKLSSVPTYYLGKKLDIPERFKVTCLDNKPKHPEKAELSHSSLVTVCITNTTAKHLTLNVDADIMSALVVVDPSRKVELAPKESKRLKFVVKFAGTDGSRPYIQTFTAKDKYDFGVKASTALHFANREAANLLSNGDFSLDDGEGGVADWTPSVKFKPGSPKTEAKFLRKEGAGQDGSSCVSMILGPEHTRMAEMRLSQRIPLKPRTRYYWSVRGQMAKNSYFWAHTAAEVRDAKGKVIARPAFSAEKEAKLGEWSIYEGGFTTPDEPTTLDYILLVSNAKYGEALYSRAELLEVEK